jgi:hypothetical protein
MKRTMIVGIWLSTLIAGVAIPHSAQTASLRWRADGNVCQARAPFTSFAPLGLLLGAASQGRSAYCAIPTGPGLVDLGDGNNTIAEVNVRLGQEVAAATVATLLKVHDVDTTSWCGCGQTSGSMAAGAFSNRKMSFDCESCSYDEDWAVVLRVEREGNDEDGETMIKLISVYDE